MAISERKKCGICGVELGIVKSQVKDGYLCRLCVSHLSVPDYSRMRELTIQDIDRIIKSYPINSVEPISFAGNKKIPEDELRQYKKMLDEGLITEEEYNLKKKKLLKL